MIDLSIIILSFNTKELLDSCLASIFGSNPKLTYEIIVVDNASSDGIIEHVEKKYPQISLIKSNKNLGYSAGNNLGVKKAQGKYLLFLNSDTEAVGQALDVMVECLNRQKKIAILGPKLIFADGAIQRSAGSFYSLKNTILMLFGLQRLGFLKSSPDKFKVVDWVSGACLMISKNAFTTLGGFDDQLFMYMEEMEFCYRAKQKGMLTGFCPEAVVIHNELGSAKKGKSEAILNIYKGLLYFFHKYFSQKDIKILKVMLKTKAIIAKAIGIIIGNNYLVTTYEQAYRLVK